MVDQARPDRGPAGGLDEVGLERSSAGVSIPRIDPLSRLDIDEHQHFQHVGHIRLAGVNPDPAPLGHVLAEYRAAGFRWRAEFFDG